MSGKSAELYSNVFEYIEKNIFKMEPNQFMCDFEKGMRKAISECYPSAELNGCWFHYCKAIRSRMISANLFRLIAEDPDARTIYRMLLSLPLLPEQFITKGFDYIQEEARKKKIFKVFKPIFRYFENFWLQLVSPFLHTILNFLLRL